ncbi:MAG: histidinol dehydrogenase [bacterium]
MRILTGSEFRPLWHSRKSPLVEHNREEQVREILASVRARGDQALLEYSARFDRVTLSPGELEVKEAEFRTAWEKVDAGVAAALRQAAANITAFYRQQGRQSWKLQPGPGRILGEIVRPLDRVGIYVPGGRAFYPSSVLMTVIPARVAEVEEIILCTPPDRQGKVHPAILVAAQLAGPCRVFKVGGAQAIAALAYGTESIPAVTKIFGPGNAFVTMAKKMVAGEVGIDGLAGPSEVVIIADDSLPPAWAAADLLAQAEHDPEAAAILITNSPNLAAATAREVERQLFTLPRRDIAARVLEARGALVVVEDWSEALDLANLVAPEHLQLALSDPWPWIDKIRNAGAIFLGTSAPVPLGDYAAGPSHVLPTGGTARFASYLGLEDFQKRSSLLYIGPEALPDLQDTAIALARAEGLEGHARSLLVRTSTIDKEEDNHDQG